VAGRAGRGRSEEVPDQVREPAEGETDDDDDTLGAREWVERRRRRTRPFFILRTSSSSRVTAFAYANQHLPLITQGTPVMHALPVAVSATLVGAVVGSGEPVGLVPSPNIAEIRWCLGEGVMGDDGLGGLMGDGLMGDDGRAVGVGTGEGAPAVGLVRLAVAPKEIASVDDEWRNGVVLTAVNQYDIYAPETHADRERKAFRTSAVGR
jgi:hypothetical protein